MLIMSKRKAEKDEKSGSFGAATKKSKLDEHEEVSWTYPAELSKELSLPESTTKRIINLIENENTIPFIVRYRKEQTGNMDASKLREFVECYNDLKEVSTKVTSAIKNLSTKGQLTPNLTKAFKSVTSLDDFDHLVIVTYEGGSLNGKVEKTKSLEHFIAVKSQWSRMEQSWMASLIYQPFKSTKKTLANRARELGLTPLAETILKPPNNFNYSTEIYKYINPSKEGLKNVSEIEIGITNIIADIIAKDCDILKFVKDSFVARKLKLESKASRSVNSKSDKGNKKSSTKENAHKFENYLHFRKSIDELESHQILAINRGESLKILSVKVDIPNYLLQNLRSFTFERFHGSSLGSCKVLLDKCITESIDRFITPLVSRTTRSQLTKKAEKAAVDVFSTNLKNLLLTPPVKGKTVMSIDPGFTNGCKIAVISSSNDILHTSTLILHKSNSYKEQEKLAGVINQFECDIIGIGNGTACRETEEVISSMIRHKKVPQDLVYCIVNESGISVYSVSDEAALELPELEPNLRSAVSLARRVIDPLSEYVKVEPQHLGVGMYQHDVSKTVLKKMLDSTVEECASDVGVDVNTCTETVLSKVSGLSKAKAKSIVQWRITVGPFRNREQLQLVNGIGPKTYEQCAGFLRIEPVTLQSRKPIVKKSVNKLKTANVSDKCNILDRTTIHPESYPAVYKLLDRIGLKREDIGTPNFIEGIRTLLQPGKSQELSSELNIGHLTLAFIAEALQKCLDYDIRSEHKAPLFRNSIRNIESLCPDLVLTGKVMNVTDFGAFIDIGVGTNGLLHRSELRRGQRTLLVGDVVEVKVINVDHSRQRIGLRFMSLR